MEYAFLNDSDGLPSSIFCNLAPWKDGSPEIQGPQPPLDLLRGMRCKIEGTAGFLKDYLATTTLILLAKSPLELWKSAFTK
jgi:hypothetical protein